MKKIYIIVFCLFFASISNISFAETKDDCSKYSSKTLIGNYDKWRCKKGKPPREKFNLKKLNIFKKTN